MMNLLCDDAPRVRQRCGRACAAAVVMLFVITTGAFAQDASWRAERRGVAGKDLNAVFFVDKNGWAAGDDGVILRTEDDGRTWSQQSAGIKGSISDIYFRNKENGYFLAGNSLYTTEDGGNSWREILPQFTRAANERNTTIDLYSVRFVNKKRGWVVGSLSSRDQLVDGLVLYTNDAGATWERQSVPVRSELIHLDFTSDERGWIVGAAGTILYTRDAGATWTKQVSNIAGALYHVDFRNERLGWTVGEKGTILRTSDGGESWFATKVPVRSSLLSVKFSSEEDGWIVGRAGVILRTSDGGRTWTRQESKTTTNLFALFVSKKNNWAVGGDGLVLRYER